jgi:16S rRNA C967 or C1407 C5-methylase (RsmB/RsmF family)
MMPPLKAEDFSAWVRDLMPEWFKEIIKAESPEAEDNMEDMKADLQKLLDQFRVPTLARNLSRKPEAEKSNQNEEGEDLAENIISLDDEVEDLGLSYDRDIESIQRAKPKKIRTAKHYK